MTDFSGGSWGSLITGDEDSAIPDSVVQRDADNKSVSGSEAGTYNGIYVTTGSSEWPQIQGRISQNSGSLGNAVVVGPDDTIIQSVDVSALSAGDVVTFDNAVLSPSTEYRFALEKADSNTTIGYDGQRGHHGRENRHRLGWVDGVKCGSSLCNGRESCR